MPPEERHGRKGLCDEGVCGERRRGRPYKLSRSDRRQEQRQNNDDELGGAHPGKVSKPVFLEYYGCTLGRPKF
jgi:hypothetical protein